MVSTKERTYSASWTTPRKGFAGAWQRYPRAVSRAIAPFHPDASANAPWTNTMVGVLVISPLFRVDRKRLGHRPGGVDGTDHTIAGRALSVRTTPASALLGEHQGAAAPRRALHRPDAHHPPLRRG